MIWFGVTCLSFLLWACGSVTLEFPSSKVEKYLFPTFSLGSDLISSLLSLLLWSESGLACGPGRTQTRSSTCASFSSTGVFSGDSRGFPMSTRSLKSYCGLVTTPTSQLSKLREKGTGYDQVLRSQACASRVWVQSPIPSAGAC